MITDVQSFLGFTGYYCYFIQNYSAIVQPLLDLTKKATLWQWADWQEQVFRTLQTHMCSGLVLSQPNFDRPFFLQTDTSAYGMGAVLSQNYDNR